MAPLAPLHRGFENYWGTIPGVEGYWDPYGFVHNETPVREREVKFEGQESVDVVRHDHRRLQGVERPVVMPQIPEHKPGERVPPQGARPRPAVEETIHPVAEKPRLRLANLRVAGFQKEKPVETTPLRGVDVLDGAR